MPGVVQNLASIEPRVLLLLSEPSLASGIRELARGLSWPLDVHCAHSVGETINLIRERRHQFLLFEQVHSNEEHDRNVDELRRICAAIKESWPKCRHGAFAVIDGMDNAPKWIRNIQNALVEGLGGGVIEYTGDGQALIEVIVEYLRNSEKSGTNWELEIHYPARQKASDLSEDSLEDLLRQLFLKQQRITVNSFARRGFSDALLLQVSDSSSGPTQDQFLLKIDDGSCVSKEADKLERFGGAIEHICPTLRGIGLSAFGPLGALQYKLKDKPEPLFDEILKFDAYDGNDRKFMAGVLEHLLKQLTERWYKLGEAGHQYFPCALLSRLDDALDANFKEMVSDLEPAADMSVADALFLSGGSGRRWRVNAVCARAAHIADNDFGRDRSAMTHGDLHTRNLIVYRNVTAEQFSSISLLDFTEADIDSPTIDFAKLEAHLVLDVLGSMEGLDVQAAWQMIERCYTAPSDTFLDPDEMRFQIADVTKVASLLVVVRRQAKIYLDWARAGRDEAPDMAAKRYLSAVFYQTLKSFKWMRNHQSFSRNSRLICALLASRICDLLDERERVTAPVTQH